MRCCTCRARAAGKGFSVLPGPVVRPLRGYLGDRPIGPLFATATGRLDQPAAWRLLRRLAVAAGIDPIRLRPAGHPTGAGWARS